MRKDLMWPLAMNSDWKMMTLSSGLASLRGQFTTNPREVNKFRKRRHFGDGLNQIYYF